MTAAITLEHVYAEIAGQPVLEDISLTVKEHEITALISRSAGIVETDPGVNMISSLLTVRSGSTAALKKASTARAARDGSLSKVPSAL